MAALPYIQLYIADYLADTMHLQAEEHGAYLLLIFNYWQTAKPIPKNRLQAIARVSNERWTDVERTLSEFFNDTGTHWQHDRIDSDLIKIEEKQSQAARAGRASAAARKAKNKQKSGSVATPVATDVEIPLEQNANHKDTDTDTDTDTENRKKKQKKSKPDSWKRFFDAYPENKKGGTDAAAWKAAQREGLDDEDFEAMVADVEKRKRLCVSWYSTYALGITRYISERFWLTPITPDIRKQHGEPNETVTDAEFINQLDPEIARQLLAKSPGDIPGVAVSSGGRPASMGAGVQAPALKRIC